MKKLIAFTLIFVCVLGFAACGQQTRQDAGTQAQNLPTDATLTPIEWLYSDTHHWYLPEGNVAIAIVYGYGEHVYGNNDGACDVCGYQGGK